MSNKEKANNVQECEQQYNIEERSRNYTTDKAVVACYTNSDFHEVAMLLIFLLKLNFRVPMTHIFAMVMRVTLTILMELLRVVVSIMLSTQCGQMDARNFYTCWKTEGMR